MNDKAVCRTAPGLLNNRKQFKLDGVGPVDNRPSTDKLHHFVKKKNNNNN